MENSSIDETSFNFVDWLRDAIKSPEHFAMLISSFKEKGSVSLEVGGKVRGTLRYWSLISRPTPDGTKRIMCFNDRSAAQAKKAYWDLHLRMSNATVALEQEVDARKKLRLNYYSLVRCRLLGKWLAVLRTKLIPRLQLSVPFRAQLAELAAEEPLDRARVVKITTDVELTIQRIVKIINGLRSFSRDASADPFLEESVSIIVDETLALCGERMKQHKMVHVR